MTTRTDSASNVCNALLKRTRWKGVARKERFETYTKSLVQRLKAIRYARNEIVDSAGNVNGYAAGTASSTIDDTDRLRHND